MDCYTLNGYHHELVELFDYIDASIDELIMFVSRNFIKNIDFIIINNQIDSVYLTKKTHDKLMKLLNDTLKFKIKNFKNISNVVINEHKEQTIEWLIKYFQFMNYIMIKNYQFDNYLHDLFFQEYNLVIDCCNINNNEISPQENQKYNLLLSNKITVIRYNIHNTNFNISDVSYVIFNFIAKQIRFINKNKLVKSKLINIIF
jgi:hypothetical protein